MEPFVHLHVHSQYSILDGQSSIEGIVRKAMGDGMRGVALTDHGNMFGAKALYNEVKKLKQEARKRLKELGEGGSREEREKLERMLRFKPILGCEMYVAHGKKEDRKDKNDQSGWHLIVLAKNEVGYHNLLHLVSDAWVDGFYFKPRTDHASLEKYREGLIVCSACLAGEIPSAILDGDLERARRAVDWYKGVWGDDFYLELQRHEVTNPEQHANRDVYERQKEVNAELMRLSKEKGVKLVCTNDCHFLEPEYAEAHDLLICISTAKQKEDTNRLLYTKQEWFKTQAEMNAVFADCPEALRNTVEICDKVEEYSIDHSPIMPEFPIPEEFGKVEDYKRRINKEELYQEFTQSERGEAETDRARGEARIEALGGYDKLYRIKLEADYLRKLSLEGAHRIYGERLSKEVTDRLAFEMHVIKTMGFPGYFLIVQDYIRAAREKLGVIVGPGRGSAAGSLVAYCLGITQIDPLRYDLLFERFLNPDRVSLPDVDVDFDDEGRGRVIDYVTRKYGADNVAHIITYGTLGVKSAIRDCCRAMGIPLQESMRLQKAVPPFRLKDPKTGKELKMTMTNARAVLPELQAVDKGNDEREKQMLDYAEILEGTVRSTGVHACGMIICKDPIADHVPVSTADDKETGQKLRCTQYEGTVIEETGLIKMDFLGLNNLTIIKETIANIKEDFGKDVDIDHIDMHDKATFKLFCEGRTVGIFQFESAGMQKYLRELKPSRLEDLIAMNALYRPGPMAYIPQFINRKHGKEEIRYDLPCMERYLKETYGVTVYQEQVMLLAREIAGFTRGESDTLRKAMGKKQKDKLDHLLPKFIEGGKANGYSETVLRKIWKDWEAFASYAFNKSHATCYAWIAYQTAFLKANYPTQYMAACMSQNLNDIGEITKLMAECRAMGIDTLGPDVNESRTKFASAQKHKIRFGLAGIKGIGEGAAEHIVKEREKNGQYKDIYDFVSRGNAASCNKGVLENLAMTGAFDSFGLKREAFFEHGAGTGQDTFVGDLCQYAMKVWNDSMSQGNSLFGGMEAFEITKPELPKVEREWGQLERLSKEKELLGIYISAHPLDAYKAVLLHVCNTKVGDIEQIKTKENIGRHVIMGGMVTGVQEKLDRNNRAFGIVKIEDFTSKGEFLMFSYQWANYRNYFVEGNALFVEGEITGGDHYHPDRVDFAIRSVKFLADVKDTAIQRITVSVPFDELDGEGFGLLLDYVRKHKGKTPLCLRINDVENGRSVNLKSDVTVNCDNNLLDFIEESCGVEYRIN